MNKSLRSSEWTLVLSFLMLFASIVLISQINRPKHGPLPPAHKKISVTFSGAVLKPGTMKVLPGKTLASLLKKSRPKRFANLRGLDLEQRVEEPLTLHLEELEEIRIRVEGAVETPLELHLPPTTRICDLKSKIACTPEADRKFLKRRRMLRDGEILKIPETDKSAVRKGVEENSEISYSRRPILKTSFARRVFSFVCHPRWG